MANPIRLVIVDDHAVVRQGLKAFLATESDIEVLGEASNGREAIEAVDLPAVNVAEYGAVVSRATRVPSSQNSTRRTPRSSLAVAVMFRVEVKVEPARGAASATVGA